MKFTLTHTAVYILNAVVIMLAAGCNRDQKLFTTLPDKETGILFSNDITETEEFNINQYLYAHNGGGVAIGDINNDGLPDIYFTANQLPNRLYLNKGNFKFEDITEKAGVAGITGKTKWTTGVVMADVNGDGLLDIYVSQVANYRTFDGTNELFINNGNLTFTERANEFGLDLKSYSQQAAFFDYDRDGDLDMYQLNHAVHNPDVYIRAELRSRRDSLAGDKLFRNDNGIFHDVSEAAGIYGGATGYGLAVGIGDIDNNGWPDIYVSNDFHENDYVYYNNCDGTFRESINGTLGHCSTFSMGNDIADINNDGLLDIITLDMKPEDEVIRKKSAGPDPYDIYYYKLSFGYYYQYPRNMLHLNRGNLFEYNVQFSEVGQQAGVDATDWSWSALLADFDNDGKKDIVITNGIIRRPIDLDYINFTYNDDVHKNFSSLQMAYNMPDGAVTNYAYKNNGDLSFTNVSSAWGFDLRGYSMGASYADLDNDGDLDLVVNNLNAPASVYRNNSESVTGNNFIRVRLKGDHGNMFGTGARVEVTTDDDVIVQELNPSRGWLSSVDYTLCFGIGKSNTIKKVSVQWPDGRIETRDNISANQTITVDQLQSVKKQGGRISGHKLFEDVTARSGITFTHLENAYVDFNDERLMPHELSTEGPRMATGDVNGDGLEDFFVGGARGQPGAIFIQRNADSVFFETLPGNVFEQDKNCEDIESVFFDADGDSDLDLYVVSGGSQSVERVNNLDRLYINDGHGTFVKSKDLPVVDTNGSCVVAADFNHDGYTDLFVGSRSIVRKYGLAPDSYLLWNTGKGNFSKDTTAYAAALHELGMVTDAAWLAKTNELVIVGEWMPVTFLRFGKNSMEKREIPNSSGWWNTVCVTDIDNDGDDDLLLGNLGLNTDLKASAKEPVGLYINDYDNNYTVDPILTYYRDHKEWIYPGLDEIKKQLPPIRLHYPKYAEFAGHTFPEVFSEASIKTSIQKKAQTFESAFLTNNDGEYVMHSFPWQVQVSPVYSFIVDDFDQDGFSDIVAAGNFYGNTPAIGRIDASYGSFLKGNGKGEFTFVEPAVSGFAVYGEVRDMRMIRAGNEKWIVVSRNSVPMRVLKNIPIQQMQLGKM